MASFNTSSGASEISLSIKESLASSLMYSLVANASVLAFSASV